MNEPFAQYSLSASYAVPCCFSASYAVTASYAPYTPFWPAQPEPYVQKDKGVQEYFEKLGYSVHCDSSRRTGECWFEICDEDGLVCQIDQGVPLEDIIMDICEFYFDRPGVSKSDYKLCGPPSERMTLLFKRVHDNKKFGAEKDGQLTLGL